MIISCSRRTDIPAFYSKWFFNRVKDGFVNVRNPFNPNQVSRISLKPGDVDCFVFWSKNPKPMITRLGELSPYNYYFQFTLNGYRNDIEKVLPPVEELINTFISLSKTIGKERIIWRYDPVLLSNDYTIKYHIDNFKYLVDRLGPYTNRCIISYIDIYKKISRRLDSLGIRALEKSEMEVLAQSFRDSSKSYGIELSTCSEEIDFSHLGISKSSCIDGNLINKITGKNLNLKKDSSQRGSCLCVKSRDIGEYNSCLHNCVYCYANTNIEKVRERAKRHDPLSQTLLI